jgi:hypothetical protein
MPALPRWRHFSRRSTISVPRRPRIPSSSSSSAHFEISPAVPSCSTSSSFASRRSRSHAAAAAPLGSIVVPCTPATRLCPGQDGAIARNCVRARRTWLGKNLLLFIRPVFMARLSPLAVTCCCAPSAAAPSPRSNRGSACNALATSNRGVESANFPLQSTRLIRVGGVGSV